MLHRSPAPPTQPAGAPSVIEHLHLVIALGIAVLTGMALVLKVVFKVIDQRWPTVQPGPVFPNLNGGSKNGSAAKWDADRIMERVEDRHDRLREILHQNHASTLSILSQMSQALDSRRETERDIAVTLKLIERHMAGPGE